MATNVRQETLTLLVLASLLVTVSGQLTWERVDAESRGPVARRDAALGFDSARHQLVLFGGRRSRGEELQALSDTWIYHIQSDVWREVTGASPPARFSSVSGVSGDDFYVTTGEGPNRGFYDDIWRFNLVSETWAELPAQRKPSYYSEHQWAMRPENNLKPSRRYGAAGGIFPNASALYLYAGLGESRNGDTLTYSLPSNGWNMDFADEGSYTPSYPHARCLHAGTMISEETLMIFGGCLSGGGVGGPCPANDVWTYNGKLREWSAVAVCPSPRTYAGLAMLPVHAGERRVVMYGGDEMVSDLQVLSTTKAQRDEVAVYNPDADKWVIRKTEGIVPTKRFSMSFVSGADGIYLFGGHQVESGELASDLYLLRGDANSADVAPKMADCNPTYFTLLMLHGISMVMAFGFFFPWGAFVARYFRHKEPLWFHLHRLFQVFGLFMAIGGFVCGVLSVRSGHFAFTHSIIGLVATVLALLQPLSALIRPKLPHAGESKSTRRVVWEFVHGAGGRAAIALGLVNISLGLFLALAHFIMWVVWYAYLGALLAVNCLAEIVLTYRRKREAGLVRRIASANKYIINARHLEAEEEKQEYHEHMDDDTLAIDHKDTADLGNPI